jgi:soluble lytic murein transglycosylase-like protein
MRIDPSMMKQLLQLQMLRNMDPFTGTETDSNFSSGSGSEFAELLEGLLGETVQPSTGKIIPAEELLARGKLTQAALSMNAFSGWIDSADSVPSVPSDYEGFIQQSSSRNGVDSSLVKAVIQAESDFNPRAVSGAGAKGLMQLMDKTGQGLGVTNPFDPAQNIEGGTRFLSNLLKKYNGNEGVALAAYNAGPARVDRLGIKNDADLQSKLHLLPRETQKYVSKVLGFKEQHQSGQLV